MQTPLFNLHDVMQFTTATLAVLLAVPMFLRRRRRVAEIALALFLLTQGAAAVYYVFLYSEALQHVTWGTLKSFTMVPLALLYLLQGQALLWFCQAISGQVTRLRLSNALRVGLVVLALASIPSLLALAFESGSLLQWIALKVPTPSLAFSVGLGVIALNVVRQHNQQIRQHYSNIDDINLSWLVYAALCFVAIWLIRLLSSFGFFVGGYGAANWIGMGANWLTTILMATMVILGLGQRRELRGPGEVAEGAARTRSASPEQIEKLENLMAQVKVYQDPNLDVDGLADSMGISPRSLSSLINGYYDQNFYDFVNHYRVAEARRLLADPASKGKTIQRIFQDAGFNSKSTFNTFFKKVTGQTPSEYRRRSDLNEEPVTG